MSIFGFGATANVDITFANCANRPKKTIRRNNGSISEDLYIFRKDETVAGTVAMALPAGKKMEHQGIRLEIIGHIEIFSDRGSTYEFTSMSRELESPGTMAASKTYSFDFSTTEKPYESYNGLNLRLRYFIRVTVLRSYSSNNTFEQDFLVQSLQAEPEVNNSIKMEVGIEDCLHIEFEYERSKYHLRDQLMGKIFFLLVRIKIKHMEMAVIRRETIGVGASATNESQTLTKFEIMDGCPARGESIPIRLMLSSIDALTPTYRNVSNRFSVKYYLNLVLVDEEDRRYFKQQEITLWRRELC